MKIGERENMFTQNGPQNSDQNSDEQNSVNALDLEKLLCQTRKLSGLEFALLDTLKQNKRLKDAKKYYPENRAKLLRELEELDKNYLTLDSRIEITEKLIVKMRTQISMLEKDSKIEIITQHILELQNEITRLERKAKKIKE